MQNVKDKDDGFGQQKKNQISDGNPPREDNNAENEGENVDGDRESKEENVPQDLEAKEDMFHRKFHGVFRYHGQMYLRDKRSLCCFDRDSKIRHACVWLVEWKHFNRFIALIILLNCLLLAFPDYQERLQPGFTSSRNELFTKIEVVFSIIYILECVFKLVACGLIKHKNSYLRSAMNWLDLFIIIIIIQGWVFSQNASIHKVLRVLRLLRVVNQVPEMRKLQHFLSAIIPGLANVLFFLLFIFSMFAIYGVSQFNGDLYSHCRLTEEPIGIEGDPGWSWPMVDAEGWLCADDESCRVQTEPFNEEGEPTLLKCGNSGKEFRISPVQLDMTIDQESIQYGIVGFDSYGQGMLTVFLIIMLEGWSNLSYNYSDANYPVITAIFFVSLIVLGGFFTISLCLGQIIESYWDTKEGQEEEMKEKQELEQSESEHEAEKKRADDAKREEKELSNSVDPAIKDRGNQQDGHDAFFDSTESMYFGSSEAEYERNSRKRAKRNGCITCTYLLVQSAWFNFAVFLLIVGNTLSIALYRFDQSDSKEQMLSWCSELFIWAFILEMILKLIGLGPKNYIGDNWNKFDAAIVIACLIDWTISRAIPPEQIGELNALKAIRLLRILKIAQFWKPLGTILSQTLASMKSIIYFVAFLFVFMFIFAVVGMELFAMRCKYNTDDEMIKGSEAIQQAVANDEILLSPRENFDTIGSALTTIFIVILGKEWNWVLFAFVRALGYESQSMYNLVMFYFFSLMIIGNVMLFTLLTAIMLSHFEGDVNEQTEKANEKHKTTSNPDTETSFFKGFRNVFDQNRRKRYKDGKEKDEREAEEEMHRRADEEVENENKEIPDEKFMPKRSINEMNTVLMHYQENEEEVASDIRPMHGKSLFCLLETSEIRKMCWTIVTKTWFDNIVIFLVIVTAISLAVTTPFDDPAGKKIQILYYIDSSVLGIFTLECILKIIAFGFIATKTAYIRDTWNILDFMIVLSSIAGLMLPPEVNTLIKSFRLLRIFRPLKSKFQSVESDLVSLTNSIPKIASLQVIVFFFMLLLAILLTTFFSGKFYQCTTEHLEHLDYRQQQNLIINKWDCINYGGEWLNPYLHFDDPLWGLLTLFTIQTKDGWIGVMWSAVDAVGIDIQPQINYSPNMVPVFIILIFIISILFLRLFICVVIEAYSSEKKLISNNHQLKDSQKSWIQVQIMTYSVKPVKRFVHTGSALGDKCLDIVNRKSFDGFITFCILINTIILAVNWYMMPQWWVDVSEGLNYIILVIFTLEAAIKITALRSYYFKENWNKYDFTIVVLTILILVVKFSGVDENHGVTSTILRILRFCRILRLIKRAEKIKFVLVVLIDGLPQLSSIGLLFFVFILIYTIIGISQFALIKIDGGIHVIEGYTDGQVVMHKHANFQSFGAALMTLFRCVTGDNWSSLMFASARERSILFQCREKEDFYTWMEAGGGIYDTFMCGSPASAFIFHLSFQIIMTQVFLNICIAIVLNSFADQANAFSLPVYQNTVNDFVGIWANYDPHATGFLESKNLEQFIIDIAESDGAKELLVFPTHLIPKFDEDGDVDIHQARRRGFIAQLKIPMYDNFQKVMFYDVLQQMALQVVMLAYNRELSQRNKKLLKVTSGMKTGSPGAAIAHVQNDYDVDFQEFLQQTTKLGIKIELIAQLKRKVEEMKTENKEIANVDHVHNVLQGAEGLYTTREWMNGLFIKNMVIHYHNSRKNL